MKLLDLQRSTLQRETPERCDPMAPRSVSLEMHDQVQRGPDLSRQRLATEPPESAERLKSRRNIPDSAGVQCACPAIVPRIERGKQSEQFGAPTLSQHDSVRSHPEGLSQQPIECQRSDPLGVRLARFERHPMRMGETEFRDILDSDDPLPRRSQVEQRTQHRCFSAARAAGHEQVATSCDRTAQHRRDRLLAHTECDKAFEVRRLRTRETDGYRSTRHARRRQHRMHSDTVSETHVRARVQFIDVSATRRDERDGERTHRLRCA